MPYSLRSIFGLDQKILGTTHIQTTKNKRIQPANLHNLRIFSLYVFVCLLYVISLYKLIGKVFCKERLDSYKDRTKDTKTYFINVHIFVATCNVTKNKNNFCRSISFFVPGGLQRYDSNVACQY